MICVNFEKDVLWQVLTVRVDELVGKVSSLRNNGKDLYFKSKELGSPYGTVILTKDELYIQVFERFKDDERYKDKDNLEDIFRDSYNGIDKPNNIFNVVYSILSKAILVKTKLDVLDNEYRQKMLDLTTSKLSTERLAEKVKNLTVMYDNKQKTSEKFKEIYNKLVFCGNGITNGEGHVSDKYKDIYIWIKDVILLSYKLNNLANVDNGIYAQFKIVNLENWIPRTFSDSHPIQIRENIKESLVLSINNVLFIPCKGFLEDMGGRFLESARLDKQNELFRDLLSGKIKKNWFTEDFDFQDLEDAASFYRAVHDKLILF